MSRKKRTKRRTRNTTNFKKKIEKRAGKKWRVRKQKGRILNIGQPTATDHVAKGQGIEKGLHRTLPNTNKHKIGPKKNKKKKSLCPILFKFHYPLQQEMLIYKDCTAELLVAYNSYSEFMLALV